MTPKLATRSTDAACDDGLAETEIYDVLRNDRRRMVLETLGSADGAVPLRDLAETVAARETGSDPPPRNARESVYITLHQTHLPKLDGLDVVDYDDGTKEIRPAGNAPAVGAYMDGGRSVPGLDRWSAALAGCLAAIAVSAVALDRATTLAAVTMGVLAALLYVVQNHYDEQRSLTRRLK